MAANYTEFVTGRVVSVNEKGLKLDGQDSWFNSSKYAVGLVLPERGQTVTVTLDRAGFLRAVELVDANGSKAVESKVESRAPLSTVDPQLSTVRDRTITRLAVLKAAAEFGAARPNLKSGDVLAIAATWERWVSRNEETTYDLTDAF